ncbi:myosin-2 heavy chain-like [Clarias magur]|uniref:Myosin-2 heavy chain-like n=1 Tax=Clarias magur TaxID=1594786 RepID=A0A8J4TFU0_CLAMG|nr:myosin-2 heavy chain-like [Clarias magur]
MEAAKTNRSVITEEEMRNQTQLVMQPYANWEEYLTPAPLSIAILGELVFISSKTDFFINKNPPIDGYKFIRYPGSFRACLMQVCNSGWGAFNEAQKNMDQIRLHTMAVPDYMKTAMKILFQDNDEIVQALLPDQLENIRVIADDCLDLANATEKRFSDVVNIIQELLEACVNAQHFYGEELDDIKRKLEEAKMRKQSSLETMSHSTKEMQDMETQRKKAHNAFFIALDSLPMRHSLFASIFRTKAIQKESANAKFRIEQCRDELNKSREIYEKSVEQMKENQKELTEILVTMRNCEVKEIDFNTTIQMLVRGMDAMGRVKEQWENMVGFFQMVSNIVKISLTRTLRDFASTSQKTQSLSDNAKLFTKDLLYNQVLQATNIASLIHMISATYTEVSKKHLMDHVSSLGKLMAMDKEKQEFRFERFQLRNSCDEAQKAILRLVLKNKQEFESKSAARLEKLSHELLTILPSASLEEIKSVEAAVESVVTEEEETQCD